MFCQAGTLFLMIVVNFKTYREASGHRAIALATACKQISEQTGVRIVAVPQLADLKDCMETGVECWVQHVDPASPGKTTGWVTIEDVEEIGAKGTLLNHSEHRLAPEVLQQTVSIINPMSFVGCVCCQDVEDAKRVLALGPDMIAYEPPELIGSRDKSVATEKPEIIADVVALANAVPGGARPVLIGAGVHSAEDVRVGLKLGAKGVLLASDVVLSEHPEQELLELAQAFV